MEGSDKKTRLGSGAPPPVSAYDPTPRAPFDAPMPVRPSLPANVPAAGVAPAPAPRDPLLGVVLAERYFVDKKLGEGGMGSVYLATHVALEKRVALKVLHAEFARKADLVERFLLEAKAASRIRHENVIDISDFGATPDNTVFFAMEFLEGKDLHEIAARAKLAGQVFPWRRARDIFLQVCAALSAAHGKGIVHRDLKPENIYLIERGGMSDFVKLLDFGIAKVTEVNDDEGRKLTRTGMLFGTPEYMSPEQARGETADHRVDIYAMGCILHQLITGDVPFRADNFMGILSLHLTEAPPAVTPEQLARVGAPPAMAGVIAKALAKNRDERFATIDQMAQAVLDAEQGRGVGPLATPVPAEALRGKRTQWTGRIEEHDDDARPAEPTRGPGGKKGLLIGLAALGAAAAAVALVLILRAGSGRSDGDPARDPAPTPEQPAPAAEVKPPVNHLAAPPTDQKLSTDTVAPPTTPTSDPPTHTAKTPRVPPRKGTDKPPDKGTDKPPDKGTDKPPEKDPGPEVEPTIGDVKTKDPFAEQPKPAPAP